MKKSIFAAVIVLLLLTFLSCVKTSQTSKNSLDWAGIYTGVIPSAGGEGIDVKFTLNADETYTVEYRYIGKSDEIFSNTGTFNWNPQGDTITLDSEGKDSFPPYYKVGEDTLTHLDLDGNIITGDLANDYILRKQR